MKLGIHAYAWCSEWSNDTLHLIDRVKGMGLDFIEIPLMVLEKFDAKAVKKHLDEADLEAVTSTVLLRTFQTYFILYHPSMYQKEKLIFHLEKRLRKIIIKLPGLEFLEIVYLKR